MVIKIRLSGTEEEIAAMIEKIGAVAEIRERSGFYPNRGSKLIGRVYLEVLI